MSADLAASITKSASKQTYWTIRFLVDRGRVADAFRAYAYFRWVDDILDRGPAPRSLAADAERAERLRFLDRQASLLEACERGDPPQHSDPHEAMLVDLLRTSGPADAGLRSYVRQMMRVMEFDVRRRGRLVTRRELDEYTGSLAVAVTDAMHHFIAAGSDDRHDDKDRYRAVAGAHIVHMLRDTEADVRAGYFNVPREVLAESSIGPGDVHCDAYRAWVRERVLQAKADFAAGESYFARIRSRRHRLAGFGYIARFSWLIDSLERDDFHIRTSYVDADGFATRLRMAASVISKMAAAPGTADRETAVVRGTEGWP